MKRFLLHLVLLLSSPMAFAQSSCFQTVFSGTAAPSISAHAVGDLLVLITYTSGGAGAPYVTGITATQSETWNTPVIGAFGASSSYWASSGGGFFISAFYSYATSTSGDALTITFNGGHPGTAYAWLLDCPGVASSGALLANMYRDIPAPGTGTDAATTAGGTGSNTVTLGSAPGALVIGFFRTSPAEAITAGTGFTQSLSDGSVGYQVEYRRVTASGTYNATATLATSQETAGWMIAFGEPTSGGLCTNSGYEPLSGIIAVPDGTSGAYLLCNGTTATPNCSSTTYYQPSGGKCGVN